MVSRPLRIVSATTISYTAIFIGFRYSDTIFSDPLTALKAISSFHSILTVICGILALSQDWPLRVWDAANKPSVRPGRLNDIGNPIIFGQNDFGNVVAGIEIGYLLYDTIATLAINYWEECFNRQSSLLDATKTLLRNETVTLVHHLTISSALSYFQFYCVRGEERGMWIMVTFILMNASTPIMQLRWWKRKQSGHSSLMLDILFCVVFGICRLGAIIYTFRTYGQYHGIGALRSFVRQDWICQVSTGALFALNAAWWLTLLRNTSRKMIKSLQSR